MPNKGWFMWNGVRSTDMGVIVTEQPDIIRPEERLLATKNVPGRSGSLTISEGEMVYDTFTVSVTCMLQSPALIPQISRWLHGPGQLVLGNYAYGYYNARVNNQIAFAQILRGRENKTFAVNFLCQPFLYLATGDVETEYTTSGVTITNRGTVFSEPYITVYGSGDISLTIGDRTLEIADVDGSIVIDNAAHLAYKGDVNLCGSVTGDDWLIFTEGTSTLSWTGNVNRVVVIPKWRDL